MTRDELTAAVLAAPDDDAPRLVLADWFAEQGDARGELIHVGCMLANDALELEQRAACERRYAELISGPGTTWLAELGLKNEVVTFDRGMVEGVALPWERFTSVADRLFASTPLRALSCRDFNRKALRQWGLMPWLGRLRALHLTGVEPPALKALLSPPALCNLRRLVIEGSHGAAFGAEGAAALSAWPLLPAIEELSLINLGVTDALFASLVPRLGSLIALDLTINSVGVSTVQTVLSRSERLRYLALGSNRIGDAGALLLAQGASLSALESLRLESTQLGDLGALAILSSSALPRLRRLDLSSNNLTDAGAVALAALPDPGLWSLNVVANVIGGGGERALRARYDSRVRI